MATQNDTPKSGSGANVEAPPPPQHHRKVALIAGITGQDGSYLAEFLLDKGYEVHGLIRRSSNPNTRRVDHIYIDPHNAHKARMKLHDADLTDGSSLRRWIDTICPDEVYSLADQYEVAVSFEMPGYTADVVATAALQLLEAVRSHVSATGRSHIRYCQAGSSEMFGSIPPPRSFESGTWGEYGWIPLPLSETTPFYPRAPYAVSKCAAHWYAMHYREAYGLFVCNGILFNHESPRRGENFLSRKITRAVGRIKMGLQSTLFLRKPEASLDWGFAGDYVEAMWKMLQQEKPDDYVVATGQSHTVWDFLNVAFGYVGLKCWNHVVIDDRYFGPREVDTFKGDARKAEKVLGWKPSVGFENLVKMMVDEDIELAKREKVFVDAGYMDVSNCPEYSVLMDEATSGRDLSRKRLKQLKRTRSARLPKRPKLGWFAS
ncbi:GDP-mannose 4,6 dehydratase 1-like [Syzygium oleosum]|uniref:GDP-mannose 4,6 dehydratase 1-like n=1 Tax=Syzygium oleosum TaxID=219896 RepID=UPI0011D19E03|nr:GDP-mannose 4,6 dehydratase 1-like [Syzygium oleosum]